ncbi:unnamed protein product [Prorocentrum cordatum]|uniref:Aspartyl/asparaginy/proline hydroxylase domain-containing protein n=1 Tax=Prorocentrum cordatum TaxID=2364126 RepID=A0ABN9P8M5_9DINO|nr:unnamed protein product [Polarella glacialis]
MDLHQELLDMIRHFVEEQFEPGAQLSRVEPLVRWFGFDEGLRDAVVPGCGRRVLVRPLEGLIPERPFHDPADHPWCGGLARHAGTFMREVSPYLGRADAWGSAPQGTWGSMDAPEWRALGLVQNGIWVAEDGQFPASRAALSSLGGFRPDEVFFALMPAGSKIGRHSDKVNSVARAALRTPLSCGAPSQAARKAGLCTLRVGDWERQWKEGEVLVFDHTFVHSAANDSDRQRVVLVCRFWHPGCSEVERYALQLLQLLTAGMQEHAPDDGPDEPDLSAGDRVEVHSLLGAVHLNGRRGCIIKFVPETSRFAVRLDGDADAKAAMDVGRL